MLAGNNIFSFPKALGLSKWFKAFLFFAFLFFSLAKSALAQDDEIVAYKGSQKQPNYDRPRIHFGFALAGNSARFVLTPTGNFNSLDTVVSVTGVSSSGFNLGIVSDLRIWKYFDLRFIPSLSFVNRDMTYSVKLPKNKDLITQTKSVESTFVEFPLELKLKSKRIHNYRVYVIAGVKYALDLASHKVDKNNPDQKPLSIVNYDYGYEIGFGFDFYLDYIKFSPELKMFNGLNNLVVHNGSQYADGIDKLYSKILVFTVTFE